MILCGPNLTPGILILTHSKNASTHITAAFLVKCVFRIRLFLDINLCNNLASTPLSHRPSLGNSVILQCIYMYWFNFERLMKLVAQLKF